MLTEEFPLHKPAPLIPEGFKGKAPQREPMPHSPPDEPESISDSEQVVPPGMSDAQAREVTPALKSQSVTSRNPKDIAARGKCPLWLVPPVAEELEARVLEKGAEKYGAWNWRNEEIALSTYISATKRHLAAYLETDNDLEDGLCHLAHARATIGIILDARAHGTLIDDRPGK